MKQYFLTLLSAVCMGLWSCADTGTTANQTANSATAKQPDYYVAAYIWPSCHDDSLTHAHLWADGENVPLDFVEE